MRTLPSTLPSDVRTAWRSLRRRPAAGLVIVLTLALGLGANATFFSSFLAMTRPLPFDEAERLVMVTQAKPASGQTYFQVSPGNFFDLRRQMTSLERVESFDYAEFHLHASTSGTAPERVAGAQVSAGLFPLLGVEPVRGRGFAPDDDVPGAPDVALLSDRLWRRSFGADPGVVGRTVEIDGRPHEIVGVMAPGFRFPHTHDLWTPLRLDPRAAPRERTGRNVDVVARLAPGDSTGGAPEEDTEEDSEEDSEARLREALAEARALGARLERQVPEANEGWSFHVRPLHEAWMPPVTQTAAWVMQVLVSLVLLIVCVNVANMVLVQATARSRETALRSALGAGRLDLLRRNVVETSILASAGGGLGLLLTAWQGDWFRRISPIEIPYWLDFRLDGAVVAHTAACTLAVALFLGVLPSLRDPQRDLAERLRGAGRADVDAGGGRARRALVVVEYAMAVIILVGAFLMVRAYQEVRQRDPGFATDGLVTARVAFADGVESGRALDFLEQAVDRLGASPGVASAAVAGRLPISRAGVLSAALQVEGRGVEPGEEPQASLTAVSQDYFRTLGIELRGGRVFDLTEMATGAPVAVVDEGLAQTLWPGADPMGRRLRPTRDGSPWLTVVGIVSRVEPGEMLAGIDANPPFQLYVPMSLGMARGPAPGREGATASSSWGPVTRTPFLVLESRLDPATVAERLRDELARLDVAVPVYDVLTMDRVLDQHYFAQHIWGVLFSVLAVVALVIAAVGAYGATAYSVARRRRELALRLALGARPDEMLRSVIRQGLGLAARGLALGALGALPLALSLERLLHGVSPFDPVVFGGVATLLLALAFVASAAPARRAASVDPAVALREE